MNIDFLKALGLCLLIFTWITLRHRFLSDIPNDHLDPFITIGDIGIIFFIVAIASFIL